MEIGLVPNSYEPGQFTLISVGLIKYSCGHISGHHELFYVKLGVWGVFIMFYWNVMKMLKCKKRKFDDVTLQYSIELFQKLEDLQKKTSIFYVKIWKFQGSNFDMKKGGILIPWNLWVNFLGYSFFFFFLGARCVSNTWNSPWITWDRQLAQTEYYESFLLFAFSSEQMDQLQNSTVIIVTYITKFWKMSSTIMLIIKLLSVGEIWESWATMRVDPPLLFSKVATCLTCSSYSKCIISFSSNNCFTILIHAISFMLPP